jgi:hypothetical protein
MTKRQRGTLNDHRKPTWPPLLNFAPDEAPDFMWMSGVELEDGTVVQAYKHSRTRRYLYLDGAGRAYAPVGRARYEEVDSVALLIEVLEVGGGHFGIVRQNEWFDGERITWARSATRHRVSRKQSLWVIQHAGICLEQGLGSDGDPLLYFFGDDENERPLEVAGAEGPTGKLTVIHSMQLRERFEDRYMEALRWRK